jgi:hypothetical protein
LVSHADDYKRLIEAVREVSNSDFYDTDDFDDGKVRRYWTIGQMTMEPLRAALLPFQICLGFVIGR